MLGTYARCTGLSLTSPVTAPAAPRSTCARNSTLTARSRAADGFWFATQRSSVRTQAGRENEVVTLLKTEEQSGDTILFVFGTVDEKCAAEQQGSEAGPEGELKAESRAESKYTSESYREPVEAAVSDAPGVPDSAAPAEQHPEVVHNENGEAEWFNKRLSTHTVQELRDFCKQKHLKGYSKLNKEELIELIVGNYSP